MIISNSRELGEIIKKRRKELGYKQDYVASVTGLSASFISNVENGKETAEIGKVLRLINSLGINCDLTPRS